MGKKYIIDEDTLVGIGDAIRNKTGNTNLIPLTNFSTQINNIKTGIEINGLIEQYKVFDGATVNAGDFIEFVNVTVNNFAEQLGKRGANMSCIPLDETRVFMAYVYADYLVTSIVEVVDGSINVLANNTTTFTSNFGVSSGVLLEQNKIFLSYGDASNNLNGLIVYINGTSMEYHSGELCSNGVAAVATDGDSCVLLEPNKVFIARKAGSSYLYGTIVEINGTTMTGTTTQLNSTSCSKSPYCVLLKSNKVFIAHSYGSSNNLYGTIVVIDGTTMTPTSKALTTSSFACNKGLGCVLLENNKVFVTHGNGFNFQLSGTIVAIDETNMTATTTVLNSTNNSYFSEPSCVLLEPNKVLIIHYFVASGTLYGTIAIINGTAITANTEFIINNANLLNGFDNPSLLINGVVLTVPGSNSGEVYITTYLLKGKVTPTTGVINGIANTSGTSGETIQVYVPKGEE